MPKNVNLAIVFTWLVAGTLDGLSAALLNLKAGAGRVYTYVASGLFGKAAFSAGNGMIAWGILFHYLIAFIFTTLWFTLFPTFKRLFKNTYIIGILYGLFTWLIMNLIIVPLSHTPKSQMHVKGVVIGMVVLMVCIGLPIALMANSFYKKQQISKPATKR